MDKGWFLVKKKEMTRLLVGDVMVPVTLLHMLPQTVIRHKTEEKDWYNALVVGAEKEEVDKKKWVKVTYSSIKEFPVSQEIFEQFAVWWDLDISSFEGVEKVVVTWISKWKGFQWVMKRFHAKWGPETHGSKFHRQVWSMGNRKPRRVQKWHPHAGHMWTDRVTLKNIPVVWIYEFDNQKLLAVKWSIPWSYNSVVMVKPQ